MSRQKNLNCLYRFPFMEMALTLYSEPYEFEYDINKDLYIFPLF